MQQDKIKVNLSGVSQTLLGPLWSRAKISRDHNSLFYDAKAIELIGKIDYDFSTRDKVIPGYLSLLFVARAKQFDDKIKAYIAEHPRASVVNVGAGLDTTFYRVDNGTIHWYDLDLPAVIEIRKQLLPEPARVTYIAKSFLDQSWCKDVDTENGIFMIAGGLLRYFEESEVRQFFSLLADNLPGGEIVFDVESKLDNDFGALVERVPPAQREELRTAWAKMLKGWWDKAPQDQKDKLITSLKLPIESKGKELFDFEDFEARWNQLSAKETEEVWRDFRAFSNWHSAKWALEDANEITKWDSRIIVIDQFPLYRNIARDPSLSIEIRQFMDYSDKSRRVNILHLRV